MSAKHFFMAAAGLGIAAVGCLGEPSDEEVRDMETNAYAYLRPDNPTGSGTTNHLSPASFHDNKCKLLEAMSHALKAPPKSGTLSPDVLDTGLLDTLDGIEVFSMAVECALQGRDSVTLPPRQLTVGFRGKGLMSTATQWSVRALSESEKEDVFRCVVARINMNAAPVDLALTGQNVTNEANPKYSGPMIEDALWDVDIVDSVASGEHVTDIKVYAWPLAMINPVNNQACVEETGDIMKRMCDDDSSNCDFEVYESAADDCIAYGESPVIYKCKHGSPAEGRPVVESWVAEKQIPYIHPECYLTSAPPYGMNPTKIPSGSL